MTYSLGQRSRSNLVGIHPDLRRIIEGAIISSTVDFGVAGKAVRTAQEQNALFKQGRSQLDGYNRKSNHQPHADGLGHAVDLTPYVGGTFIVTEKAWDYYPAVASAMSVSAKALGLAGRLKWGCNWYETMGSYGSDIADMTAALERYKRDHPGPDFIDGPHFELA
ncbi:MAG: hypothetical protein ACOH2H_16285 [Cypionkella sp.]